MSITEEQLDQIHEQINALGGRATDITYEYDRGTNDAIRDALRIIESFGGMDPQDRAGDRLADVVRELSDRNEILDNKLRVQTIRRQRAEVQRDALSARLTRDGVPDYVTVTASDTEGPETKNAISEQSKPRHTSGSSQLVDTEDVIKRLECKHDTVMGGDGYFGCERCGVVWDSRRETADTVARRDAIARLREQQREVERLRAERFALREGVLSALGGTGCDTPGGRAGKMM